VDQHDSLFNFLIYNYVLNSHDGNCNTLPHLFRDDAEETKMNILDALELKYNSTKCAEQVFENQMMKLMVLICMSNTLTSVRSTSNS